jgi:hypothetical protein
MTDFRGFTFGETPAAKPPGSLLARRSVIFFHPRAIHANGVNAITITHSAELFRCNLDINDLPETEYSGLPKTHQQPFPSPDHNGRTRSRCGRPTPTVPATERGFSCLT